MFIILGISCRVDTNKYCVKSFSGEEAYQIVFNNIKENNNEKCDFELILMDCMMPNLDGFKTSSMIR